MDGATQQRGETEMTRLEIAEKIAEMNNGRVWVTDGEDGKIRVYVGKKGYAEVNADGVNIDPVGRNEFDDIKTSAEKIGVNTYRR